MNRKNKNYSVELWRAYNKQFGKIFSAAGATQKKPRQAAETLAGIVKLTRTNRKTDF